MTFPPPSSGSIALVTGASAGIGEQFARQLVARGYRVIVTARRDDRLQTLCSELGGDEHAVAVAADLAIAKDRDRLAARVADLGMPVDILVNNAGSGIFASFGAEGRDKELQQLGVDVDAVADLTLRFLPEMVERGRGAIINVSSALGFQPGPYSAGYAAAKAYVLWLSEAVNLEVAHSGVTVTAVCPGPVSTEFFSVNDADFLLDRMPRFTRVTSERVVADALRAAGRGRAVVVPGGPLVRFSLGLWRALPASSAVPILGRTAKR